MKKYFLLLLILATVTVQAQDVKKWIRRANELIDDNKADSAWILLQKARAVDSTNYDLIIPTAEVYYLQKKYQDCYDVVSEGIHRFQDSVYLFFYRAGFLYSTVNTEAAIDDYTTVLKMADNDTLIRSTLLNRGACYTQRRDFQLAYEDYVKANLIDSTNIDVLNNMATVLDELGRRDEAVAILKRMTTIDSNYLGAYVNLGFQHTRMGKYKEALAYFDKALQINSKEPLTWNNRGSAKYYLKDYKGALEDINKSLSMYPENSYAYRNRALVYIAQGQKEKACADINKALELGFTKMYGPEVEDLQKEHCGKN